MAHSLAWLALGDACSAVSFVLTALLDQLDQVQQIATEAQRQSGQDGQPTSSWTPLRGSTTSRKPWR